jgi:hypothetical protein
VAERRGDPPGRREDDRAIDLLVDRLRSLEEGFRHDLDRLGDEVDDLRDSAGEAGEALRRAMDALREAIDKRVRELEEFHITERARTGELIVRRLRRAQLIATVSAAAGALGVVAALAEHFLHI